MRHSVDIVLQTLDTITDFTKYLTKKERLLSSQIKVHAPGEEELLAFYLKKLDENEEHDFILPKENMDAFMLEEGFWEDFVNSAQRKSQLEANQISYSWDALIETFNKHILDDTQYYAYPGGATNQEKTVKFLARENRTRRRMLIKAFYELLAKTPTAKRGARVIAPSYKGDPYYVFLLLPKLNDQQDSEYREMRRGFLQSYCMVVKYKFPDAEDIIGFATESGRREHGSEDLIYFDARQWTEEEQKDAEYFHNEIEILKTVSHFTGKEYEFPLMAEKKRKRRRSKKN